MIETSFTILNFKLKIYLLVANIVETAFNHVFDQKMISKVFFQQFRNLGTQKSRNIFVLNCGSSSIKFQVVDPISRIVYLKGKKNLHLSIKRIQTLNYRIF